MTAFIVVGLDGSVSAGAPHGGHVEMTGFIKGSVSLRCLRRAACPVTVVPAFVGEPSADAPVVVGVKDAASSRAAVSLAVEGASVRGTQVVAVRAVQWQRLGTELIRPPKDQLVEWGTRLLAQSVATTQQERPDVTMQSARFTATLITSSTSRSAARTCSSSAPDATDSWLACWSGRVGSVSLHMLTHANCPTAVIVG